MIKAVAVLLFVAVALAQPLLLDSSCYYNEASLPESAEFGPWVAFRRATCENIENEQDCNTQGYCWLV